jgi:hypothetical protein
MGIFQDEPTDDLIQRAESYYSHMWENTHSKWGEWDDLYQLRWNVWPKNVTDAHTRNNYRTSKARSLIDHASATLLSYSPRFHRTPLKDNDSQKDSADRLEKGMKAVFDDAGLKETSLPWKKNGLHMLLYGYGVVKQDLNMSERPKKPQMSAFDSEEDFNLAMDAFDLVRNWNPVTMNAVNPATVLLDYEDKRSPVAIEKIAMPMWKVQELVDKKKRQKRKVTNKELPMDDPFAIQQLHEFWTDKWHAVKLKGGEILYTERNTWGFTPFAHAFAGFGTEPVNDAGPEWLAVGILFAVSDSLKLQNQSMNASMALLTRTAYANLGYDGDNMEGAVQLARAGIMQGEKEDWWLMPSPEMQSWMFGVQDTFNADIEEGTYPRALSGAREAGVTTVGQQAILLTQSRGKFREVAIQGEHMATIVAENILRWMTSRGSTLGPKIGANGEEIRKSDIHSQVHITASFEVADPVLDLQRRELGIREVGAGLKDAETYWEEDARVEDVSERKKRLLQHIVRNMPSVQVELAQEVANEMGLGEVFERAIAPEQAEAAPTSGAPAQKSVQPGTEPAALNGTTQAAAANDLRQPLEGSVAKPGTPTGTEFNV